MPVPLIGIKPGASPTMRGDDRPTFDEWMNRIDRVMFSTRGLTTSDLPDCEYRDWYDDRIKPIFAANRALRRAADQDDDEGDECD
jgi:hypothetical protein